MSDWEELLHRFVTRLSMEKMVSAAITLLICLLVTKLLLKLARRVLSRTKMVDRVRRYILAALKVLLYTLTVVFTASGLGINMNSLVALLSVGSLGITLAAEDVLANVAGGVVILSSRLFALGDFIESGGVTGTVEEIGPYHTKLTTPDGLTALLPNKELAAGKVINYTALGRRRIVWKMTAAYDVPTEAVKSACLHAVKVTEHILEDPAPAVYLTSFGNHGIDFTVYCWVPAADFWVTQFALAENLRKEFGKAGIRIPYNRLDVHIQEPGKRR